MPMDGLTLGFAARELNDLLAGGRVDRVTQPEKDTVILLCRVGGVNRRLLLCASAQNARCHLTQRTYPNPLEPPMFCMLLRKQLLGGRVLAVRQLLGDRVIHVDIEAVDELGDYHDLCTGDHADKNWITLPSGGFKWHICDFGRTE